MNDLQKTVHSNIKLFTIMLILYHWKPLVRSKYLRWIYRLKFVLKNNSTRIKTPNTLVDFLAQLTELSYYTTMWYGFRNRLLYMYCWSRSSGTMLFYVCTTYCRQYVNTFSAFTAFHEREVLVYLIAIRPLIKYNLFWHNFLRCYSTSI